MVTQTPAGAVEFKFFRPQARQVSLAGEFNNWQTCFYMTKDDDGWWRCRLDLAPGVYEFKYSADGQWYIDYAAFGLMYGPYGLNSVVKVNPPNIKTEPAEPAEPETQIQAA